MFVEIVKVRPLAVVRTHGHCAPQCVTGLWCARGPAAALWLCRRPFANKARVFWQELVRWRGVVLKHGAGVPLGDKGGHGARRREKRLKFLNPLYKY